MPYVPIVVEQSEKGERAYDIYSRLLEERIVFITGHIDDDLADTVIAQLLYLQSKDSQKDVYMYINSPGGQAYAGLAIYDTVKHLKCDVSTICVGMAASAATVLLSAGAKGKRLSLPHSMIHIHQPVGEAGGQATDIKIQAEEILRLKNLILELLVADTGQPREKVERDIDRDFYMTAAQAKEYGVIDEVIELRK